MPRAKAASSRRDDFDIGGALLSDDEADRGVAAPAAHEGPAVDAHQVALGQASAAGDAVDNGVVDTGADHSRERGRGPRWVIAGDEGVAAALSMTFAATRSSSDNAMPTSARSRTAASASATTRPASRRTAISRGVFSLTILVLGFLSALAGIIMPVCASRHGPRPANLWEMERGRRLGAVLQCAGGPATPRRSGIGGCHMGRDAPQDRNRQGSPTPAFFTVVALARALGLSLDDDLSLDALPGGVRFEGLLKTPATTESKGSRTGQGAAGAPGRQEVDQRARRGVFLRRRRPGRPRRAPGPGAGEQSDRRARRSEAILGARSWRWCSPALGQPAVAVAL